METFGDRLRRLRQGTGKSAAEFAAQIGLTTDAELKLESGKRGRSFVRLPVIARALGCRIDDLFPEMDDPGAEMPSKAEAPETETAADDWPDGWRD